MSEKMVIKGFIRSIAGEQVVIECCEDREIMNLVRTDMPINARVGDFIVYDKRIDQYSFDHKITKMQEQELRRLSEDYWD